MWKSLLTFWEELSLVAFKGRYKLKDPYSVNTNLEKVKAFCSKILVFALTHDCFNGVYNIWDCLFDQLLFLLLQTKRVDYKLKMHRTLNFNINFKLSFYMIMRPNFFFLSYYSILTFLLALLFCFSVFCTCFCRWKDRPSHILSSFRSTKLLTGS